jgi:hypothetical protein
MKFKPLKQDAELIHQIAQRGVKLGHPSPRLTLEIDIEDVHANGCPLDLPKLLAAPDFDFMHDVMGITHHIQRWDGKLADCFLPRYARKV